jgi:hypothetical protein
VDTGADVVRMVGNGALSCFVSRQGRRQSGFRWLVLWGFIHWYVLCCWEVTELVLSQERGRFG